jgi:phage gp29-like protein
MAIEETKPQKPDLSELASTRNGRDITRGYIDGLPYITSSDAVLLRAGGLLGYEKMLQDDQVSACFAQRRNAVISQPWSVTPGGTSRKDKLAAALVEDTLKSLDWDTITDQMLYARFYGYGVAEVLWCVKDNLIRIQDIRVRDRRRFVYAPDYSLRLLTMHKPDGEVLPERKFWHKAVGASHADEPYGLGLGHALYWPVWLKHNGAKFWATYLEKFAAPTAMGTFPMGTSDAERIGLLQTLQAISTDAGIIVPEGMTVDLIEATRGGSATYENWMEYWDSTIAKIILGQTMTTEDGSSYAQATVHYNVRQDLVMADSDFICQSANGSWVRWLVDYNVPGAAYPQVWRDMEDAEDLKERVSRDKSLFDMGFRLKAEAVTRIYGDDYEQMVAPLPEPEKEAPGASEKPNQKPPEKPVERELQIGFRAPQLAEPESLPGLAPIILAEDFSPVPIMTDRLEQDAAKTWDAMLVQIEQLMNQADNLPQFRDNLLAAYGDLPIEQLGQVMGKAFVAAELAGRYDVYQESDHA